MLSDEETPETPEFDGMAHATRLKAVSMPDGRLVGQIVEEGLGESD